ncbi:MAG: Ldh family oxidoreductase [Rhizobiales bacterium]|nr:Ldh family oxidoreductase [Hyphomicrobiales bacterium]
MTASARPDLDDKKNVAPSELTRFVVDVFVQAGMSSDHASAVAEALVWANLRGVDSHGVVRIPRYLEMIDRGLMNVDPKPTCREPSASSIVIEADRAAGPVVLTCAVRDVVERARRHGLAVAVAVVGQMTHSGALGYYTQKAAAEGLACIAVNSGIPLMPYHGARGAALGTNPISIAVPGEHSDPIVFDMASSAVSAGKLALARKSGMPLDRGWAVDERGDPTIDPRAAAMSAPLGGPKGSGLALMIECLTSLLAGHPIVSEALRNTGDGSKHRQNAMLIAIDVARFVDLAVFRAQIGQLAAALKAMPRTIDSDDILLPGERGYRAASRRRADGIPLSPATIAELSAVAERKHISPLVLRR